MEPQIVVFIKYFFGEDARIERKFGYLRISTRQGDQVEFINAERGFRNYIGGAEIYRSALKMMHHITGGPVPVRGSSDDILALMAYGRELSIPVMPQGEVAIHPMRLTIGMSGFVSIFAWFFTCIFGNFIDAIWIGFLVWAVVGFLSYPYFKRSMEIGANRTGQQYRDIFPEIHGSDRRSAREAARQRGLL